MFKSLAAAGVLLLAFSQPVFAEDGKRPWERYGDRIGASQKIDALGDNLFGDQVGLSNGALSFAATDISLPGNGPVVAIGRSYSVRDMRHRKTDGMFGDWDAAIPSISAIQSDETGWVDTNGNQLRCSIGGIPQEFLNAVTPQDYWQGPQLDIPGVGGGEILKTVANTPVPSNITEYPLMTNDGVRIKCLPSIKNGGGEGFLAITADGTRYWFDWMSEHHEPTLETYHTIYNHGHTPLELSHDIRRHVLYATRVEDRFGNVVTYTYDNTATQPGRLVEIDSGTDKHGTGGDGRHLDFTWVNGRIDHVFDGGRTWTYSYAAAAKSRTTLTGVALPDGQSWTIDLAEFTEGEIGSNEGFDIGEMFRSCLLEEIPANSDETPIGTMVHPSGAIGEFTTFIAQHGRSNVPLTCNNVVISEDNTPNNTNDDTPFFPFQYQAWTLKSKKISGSGVVPATWNYSYDAGDLTPYMYEGTTRLDPVCHLSWSQCIARPPCVGASCDGFAQTLVNGPNGQWVRYRHGNSYRKNEGKLLQVDVGGGGPFTIAQLGARSATPPASVLRTTTNTYDYTFTGTVPYLKRWGLGSRMNGDSWANEYHRPLTRSDIVQQGVTFSWQALTFDAFARPLTVRRSSTLGTGNSRDEATTYFDLKSKWIVGQVATVTNTTLTPDLVLTRTAFDPVTALPITIFAPNLVGTTPVVRQVLTYNADGTLATVKDGRNNVTTLSDWYRGVPRLVAYPDGKTQAALVNGYGWITRVTDQNGFATNYGYDAGGRINLITYPTGDSVVWNSTSLAFEKTTTTTGNFGFPIGTWRQTVTTGNGQKVTWFDALWRPLLTREFDTANPTTIQRFNAWAYDASGRTTFVANPLASATSLASFTQGIWTEYDALGRQTSVNEDSELGPLTTLTEYLSGFQTRTTNPRDVNDTAAAYPTTTSFYAWDSPESAMPRMISAPEAVTTTITRDAAGRTTRVNRAGTWSGGSQTLNRDYRYDGLGQLERTWVPEEGAMYFDYDAAGNLQYAYHCTSSVDATCGWTAAGARPPVLSTRTYDSLSRVSNVAWADGVDDATYTYTPDGLLSTLYADDTTWTYQYNRRRLLTQQKMFFYSDYIQDVAYDTNGHVVSTTIGSDTIAYLPNALGQPTQAGIYATGVQYHPNGAVKQFNYGNGIVHTLSLNARMLPDVSKDALGASRVFEIDTDFDANGNVARSNDLANPGNNRSMSYDALDRLVGVSNPSGEGWSAATYTYDVLDNLRTNQLVATAGTTTLAYIYSAANNRLTKITPTGQTARTYVHDARGNITSDGRQAYTWTAAGRMAGVTGKETYQYDGHGRRTVVWRADTTGSVPMYGVDGKLLLTADNRLGGANLHIYLGDDNIADVFTRWSDGQKTVEYLHTDALGSPVARTNAAGAVIPGSRIVYAPYGQMVPGMIADGISNDINYTGHAYDTATGLVYMQQRYYDPSIGRFVSADPMTSDTQNAWNFNRYNYAANNPYRFVDPDGRRLEAREKGEQERVSEWFNGYGDNEYKFDNKGRLAVDVASSTPNEYDRQIVSVINDSKLMIVDISNRVDGNDVRSDHGNAATSLITYNGGQEGVMLTLTGYALRNDPYTGDRLRYADGTPLFDTPADLLLHEFSGHGVPLFFRGRAAGSENAVDHDNYVRSLLHLKLRPADPEHTVVD